MDAVLQKLISEARAKGWPEFVADPATHPEQSIHYVTAHLMWFVDAVAAHLTSRLGPPVSTCVKFFWLSGVPGEPKLRTLFRSSNTRIKREADAQPEISFHENSAFSNIILGWPGVVDYRSDDLFQHWLEGSYSNTHHDWFSSYLSTAVTAIPSEAVGSSLPIGFFCADSVSAKLAQDWVGEALRAASAHIYEILGILFSSEHKVSLFPAGSPAIRAVQLPSAWSIKDGKLGSDDIDSQTVLHNVLRAVRENTLKQGFMPGSRALAYAIARQQALFYRGYAMPEHDDEELELFYGRDETEPAENEVGASSLLPGEAREALEKMADFNSDAAAMLKQMNEEF